MGSPKDYLFGVVKSASVGPIAQNPWRWFMLTFGLGILGGLLYILPKFIPLPGIKNNAIYHNSLTRGLEFNIRSIFLGLTIAGTSTTLYDVMDYLAAKRPIELIREKLRLSKAQAATALFYIRAHRAEVEAEYEEIAEIAKQNRQYWNQQSKRCLTQASAVLSKQERAALHSKLQLWQGKLAAKA